MLHNGDLSGTHREHEIKSRLLDRPWRGETDSVTWAGRQPCPQGIYHSRTLQTLGPVGCLIPQGDLDFLIALVRLQEQTYFSRKRFAVAAVDDNVPYGKGPQAASQGKL